MAGLKLSHALARFVFASLVILGILITILVATRVISAMQRQQEQLTSHEISTISSSFRLFLSQRMLLLEDQAKQSVVVQSVMQPQVNAGIIRDYMDEYVMLGKGYAQRIVDFEGIDIFSHSSLDSNSLVEKDWLKALLRGDIASYTGVTTHQQRHYWLLAQPVRYNRSIEGAIVTQIPLADINHQRVVGGSHRFNVELLAMGQRLILFGDEISGDSYDVQWPQVGITLRFTLDRSVINAEVNDLILELGVLICSIMLIATTLAYYYGIKRFVEPLQRLSNATNDITRDEYIALRENVSIIEIANLMRSFNLMARQIKEREAALKVSIEQTNEANEQLKLTQSQVVESEKMASLGLLSAGIAHEINNPMAFVKSNIDTLEQYCIDIVEFIKEIIAQSPLSQHEIQQLNAKYDIDYLIEDLTPLLNSSQDGVTRVVDIVNSLKLFARVDNQIPEQIDINRGIEATLAIVRNEIKYKSDIKVLLAPVPKIYGFAGKINQVVLNLVINASQSLEEHGTVRLCTYHDDKYVYIEVEDDGCGIQQEKLNKIFEPFYSTKQHSGGTGLGLSISHGIIKQHGGDIRVKSTVGEGSCFTVVLPIERGKQTEVSS